MTTAVWLQADCNLIHCLARRCDDDNELLTVVGKRPDIFYFIRLQKFAALLKFSVLARINLTIMFYFSMFYLSNIQVCADHFIW